jgi:hypothetical protein
MNQKIAFYLLSIIAIFFIGYNYSQLNIEPVKPEIITINNNDLVEEYKSNNLSLHLQLEELNNQLIFSLNELKITSQKLNLSLSKIQVLEEQLSSTQNAFNLSDLSLKNSIAKLLENEKTLKELKKGLSNAELDIKLIKFDLEIAEARLRAN